MSADVQTIGSLSRALKAQDTTAQAVLDRCLARISERNGTLNAFIAVFENEARRQAAEADREIAAGRYRGPLHGVPVSLKDLFDVRGTVTTAASRVRRNHLASRDASAVTMLRNAGAVLIGKTNLHEFAFGTTNEDSAFGPARHPLDPNRSPGGSSGGSAVSVADGMCFASLGTDTGGSIRIPSAVCGLVGLKPAFGDLSTDGVVPLSATLDHIGPLCRSVEDAAIVYEALSGNSPRVSHGSGELRGLTFGIPRPYFLSLLDGQVAAVFESVCDRMRDAGVRFVDVSIPHAGDVPTIYLHIVLAEGAAYHAKTLERCPEDYTPNVRMRLEMGRYVMGEDYARALRGRELIRGEVNAAMKGLDGLLLPAMPIPAPRIGAPLVRVGTTEEPVRNVMLRCTQAFNLSGHAAIALPCGSTAEGWPVGAQLVGADTAAVLSIASRIESTLDARSPVYLGPGTSR